jgi:hypothetical protein
VVFVDSNIELYVELLKKVLTASIYDESAWTIKSKAAIRPGKPMYDSHESEGKRI